VVVGDPTSLNLGQVTQAVAAVRITENFKGALALYVLATSGQFQLVLPGGLSFSATPTVTYTVGSATPVVMTTALTTTFAANDTLTVNCSAAALAAASVINITNVNLNVPSTASFGPVALQLAEVPGAPSGVRPAFLTLAYVGPIPELTLSDSTLSVAVGEDGTVDVTSTDSQDTIFVAVSSDAGVATVASAGGTITVSGVAEGTCNVTVTGNHSGVQATLAVTVGAPPAAADGFPAAAMTPVDFPTATDPTTTQVNVAEGNVKLMPTMTVADCTDVVSAIGYIYIPAANFGLAIPATVTCAGGVASFDLGTVDFTGFADVYYVYFGYVDASSDIHYNAYELIVN
jgi:hypothetical protein